MDVFGKTPLLKDGAMGTMLFAAGLVPGQAPDCWCVENPSAVLSVHRAYAAAGANLLVTDSFGANDARMKNGRFRPEDILPRAVELAQKAASEASHPCFCALDIGPLGLLLEPYGELTQEEARAIFSRAVKAGAAAGPDCVLIETMTDLGEACAALEAAKDACGLPVFVTMSFAENGRLFTGASVDEAVAALEERGADGVGCNCGLGPVELARLLPAFTRCAHAPLLMNPNAGLPRMEEGRAVYELTPEDFARFMLPFAGASAVLGGCCGTTPAHIAALCTALETKHTNAV